MLDCDELTNLKNNKIKMAMTNLQKSYKKVISRIDPYTFIPFYVTPSMYIYRSKIRRKISAKALEN